MKENIHNKAFGNWGEKEALKFLKKLGYRIEDKNFRSRAGEIDIIAYDKDVLVFIEVKTRRNEDFCPAVFAIDRKKQQTMQRVALFYLCVKGIKERDCRFDVVILTKSDKIKTDIELIRNAFSVED